MFFFFFLPFTAVTPSDLNKMGGSSFCPGMYEALIPNEGASPHIFLRHCMQCVDLPMQEQLLGRQISYSSYICNLNAYLTALRNATTDHIESAQGVRLLPSISRLCVIVLLLLNKDFFTAKRFEYFPARQQVP